MTYASKVAADGAIHHWPLDDDEVSTAGGTPSASAEPFGSSFNAAKVVDGNLTTGWAISTALCNGSWWKIDFGVTNVSARGVVLRARDAANASPGTDNNPACQIDLSDGTSVVGSAVAVNGTIFVDFGGLKTFTWLKVTFTAAAPGGGNPGWSYCGIGGVTNDLIGALHGYPIAGHALTYQASGPSSIASSKGVTVPAADGSYITFDSDLGVTGNSDRTLEFWAKTTRTGSAACVLYGANATRQLFGAVYNSDGIATADIIAAAGSDSHGENTTGHAQRDGSWHHIAIVYDGASKTAEVFFDGVSVGTTTAFGANLNTGTTRSSFGAAWTANGFYLDGSISNVAIYSSKLSSAQVADHAAGDASSGGPSASFQAVIVV